MLERELEFAGKVLNPLAKVAFSERGQLVEQRLDDGWVEDDHDELERDPIRELSASVQVAKKRENKNVHEAHQPRYETVTCPLEDVQENSKERCPKNKGQPPTLQEVGDEESRGRFIESVFLLQNERSVCLQWQSWN